MQTRVLHVFAESRWLRMLGDKPQRWGLALHPFSTRPQHRPLYTIIEPCNPIDAIHCIQQQVENAAFDYSITPLCLVSCERDDSRGLTVGGWTLRRGLPYREIFQAQIVLLQPHSLVEREFRENAKYWLDTWPLEGKQPDPLYRGR